MRFTLFKLIVHRKSFTKKEPSTPILCDLAQISMNQICIISPRWFQWPHLHGWLVLLASVLKFPCWFSVGLIFKPCSVQTPRKHHWCADRESGSLPGGWTGLVVDFNQMQTCSYIHSLHATCYIIFHVHGEKICRKDTVYPCGELQQKSTYFFSNKK